MKDLIIKDISQHLQGMGFNIDITGDADISVNELLTAGSGDASHNTPVAPIVNRDTHKLEITLAIALDLKEKELLYYEKIEERSNALANSGMGFDFGMETEVQLGRKTGRTITRVQQNDSGEIVTVAYDLGAISGVIREIAAKYGLRFKTVLTMSKIKRHSHQEYDGFSGANPVPAAVNPADKGAAQLVERSGASFSDEHGASFSDEHGASFSDGSAPRRKGLGILFVLLWFFSLGFFLLILLAGSTSLLGALLVIGTHVLMLLIYWLFTHRGWLQGVLLWAVMVIIAFVAMMVTTDFDTVNNPAGQPSSAAEGTGESSSQASGSQEEAASKDFIFDHGHFLMVYPWADTQYNNDGTTTHRLVLTGQIFQRLSVEPPLIADVNTEVVRAVISDVSLVRTPVAGVLTAIRPASDLNLDLDPRVETGVKVAKGALDQAVVYDLATAYDATDSYTLDLAFEFDIRPLAEYTYPKDYSGEYSAEKTIDALGLNASDYNFELQYTLTVYTADEQRYVLTATTSPFTGDFLRDGSQATYDQRP